VLKNNMNKKIIVPLIVLFVAAPLYIAMADDTSTTGDTTAATADCGSAPAALAAGATVQDRQQYKQDFQQYNQCKRDQLKGERQNLQDQKQQFTQERCDLINQRISDRLNNFQSKQNGDETIFGNIYQRIDNIATRLKNDNLDTAKLVSDLTTLKTKIDKVNTDYASFIDSLKTTANTTCGHSQGEFMGKLGAARGILLSVRQDRLDVKNYILNTIKPDILTLRQQLAKSEQTNKSAAGSDSATATTPNVIQ
jgi:L-cysteine desulfidase